MAGNQAQRSLLAAAADQDPRPACLDRPRLVERGLDPVEAALERRTLLREHEAADRQRLVEAVHALADAREIEPVPAMLRLVPGRPHPQDGPAAGDHVERRHDLRQVRWGAVGDAGDERPDPDARGPGGDPGKGRIGLEHRRVFRTHPADLVEVVHHGHEVEAHRFGAAGDVHDVLEERLRPDSRERVVGKVVPEHRSHRPNLVTGMRALDGRPARPSAPVSPNASVRASRGRGGRLPPVRGAVRAR